MKRSSLSLPLLVSFVLFILLCVSLTYWVLQLIKPSARPVAVVQESNKTLDIKQAASELFGGRAGTEIASNFQLKGVIVANKGSESVAILAADGKPANAFILGKQVAPGTTLQEISSTYVVLTENGVQKRIALPLPVNEIDGKASAPAPVPVPVPVALSGKTSDKTRVVK